MSNIRTSRETTRAEAARYLRKFADQLADGDGVTDETGTSTGSGVASSTTASDPAATDETGPTSAADTPSRRGEGTSDRSERVAGEGTADPDAGTTEDGATDARSAGSPSKVTFLVGNESATVRPPENVTFEVDVSTDTSLLESGTRERVEFAIEWNADDVSSDDELSIE